MQWPRPINWRNGRRVLFLGTTRVTKISRYSVKDPIQNIDDARLRPHLRGQKPKPQLVPPDNGVDHIQTFNGPGLPGASPGDMRGLPATPTFRDSDWSGSTIKGTQPERETIRRITAEEDRAA